MRLFSDKKVTVTAGVHDRTKQEPTQQIRESGSFKMHGEFDTNYLFNNVGLIYLSDPLQLNGKYNLSEKCLYTIAN